MSTIRNAREKEYDIRIENRVAVASGSQSSRSRRRSRRFARCELAMASRSRKSVTAESAVAEFAVDKITSGEVRLGETAHHRNVQAVRKTTLNEARSPVYSSHDRMALFAARSCALFR